MCDLETWVILQAETQISTSERSTTPPDLSFCYYQFSAGRKGTEWEWFAAFWSCDRLGVTSTLRN